MRGEQPQAGLVADGAGNLYWTTYSGGAGDHGTVFELTPPAAGKTAWTEKVIHSFHGKTNGAFPAAGLIADGAGNLYGTASGGCGVVFKLSPPPAGETIWTETVLHSFDLTNGADPQAGLIADGAGNLYGTTEQGGANNDGVVFELSPAAGKTAWTATVRLSFHGTNGANPVADLIADGAGNLYGTAESGGAHGDGVVFRLTP
jgi:uncharacterized repeat protein (TIGR03803 family)